MFTFNGLHPHQRVEEVSVARDWRPLGWAALALAAAALMVISLPPRARVPELVIIPTTQSFT